jgi:hypothetical protein
MAEFYKHSGAVSVGGLLGGAVLGMGAAAGLSALYAYGIKWIPFIYINALLTAGFGLAIGCAVYFAARLGKVRNTAAVAAVGLLCGLVGVYYAWAFDRVARAGHDFTMDPVAIWDYVQVFNANGDWAIGRNAKEPVTGIFLWLVWAVEAGVIAGVATYMPYTMMRDSVFCEACNQWAKDEEDVRRLAIDRADEIAARLQAGDLSILRSVSAAPAEAPGYLRLDLTTCESCDQSNYLSVVSVLKTTNKKGEEETQTHELVKYLLVSPADVAAVREAGPAPSVEPDSTPA